jgi:hypothetical protein
MRIISIFQRDAWGLGNIFTLAAPINSTDVDESEKIAPPGNSSLPYPDIDQVIFYALVRTARLRNPVNFLVGAPCFSFREKLFLI